MEAARFEVVDLRAEMPGGWPAPAAIAVDPPRRGLDEPVLGALVETSAESLVYMSCDARSFARDVAALCAAGWRLDALEIHDMLPQTTHVELLGFLGRS